MDPTQCYEVDDLHNILHWSMDRMTPTKGKGDPQPRATENAVNFLKHSNTYVVTDVLSHDVSGCIGHNSATTSTTILSLPGPLIPVADEQMEEVRAVLENGSSATTSLIENFPKTNAFQDILKEISPLASSSNKERKREKNQFK
ncbi:hypothetical protein AVEN_61046-1 [Araneus ventricosus]|uniref:Uncharacterized protein n=1 Tax=Araneus ventricosus TaxID=182803 RepID=A0A4Y2DUG3_ARAVE|nr:hypothetical protein AVEN_61046-1 [Araneus ventricosus]